MAKDKKLKETIYHADGQFESGSHSDLLGNEELFSADQLTEEDSKKGSPLKRKD